MADKSAGGADVKKEEVASTAKKRSRCFKCLFWTFSVTMGLAAVMAGFVFYPWTYEIPEEIKMQLGEEGIMTFHAFDRNQNGQIEIEEFEALYQFFKNGGKNLLISNVTSSLAKEVEYDQEILPTDEVVSLVPSFKPLDLTSMTMDADRKRFQQQHGGLVGWLVSGLIFALDSFQEGKRAFYGRPDPLYGLKSWKTPNKKFLNFAVRHFDSLFPKPTKSYFGKIEPVGVGKVYRVVEDSGSLFAQISQDFSSNRYVPPVVTEKHLVIHRLLTIFHPRPFIKCRFQPRGMVAVVRAMNEKYMDIVFRIHAEFQLNKPPGFPFWFTPGQFTGHLIVTRDFKHIEYFNMYVPNTRRLNVDMEWLEGVESMVVDIGYMPEMSLVNTAPSTSAEHVYLADKIPRKKIEMEDIDWTQQIPEAEAFRLLEMEMYPFTKVPYYNFTESLELAQKQDKYIHHILLWGALDDQSC